MVSSPFISGMKISTIMKAKVKASIASTATCPLSTTTTR
jgi:hypothetical protein